jgi:pyruvate,water dikinase
MKPKLVYPVDLAQIGMKDLPLVGGKNASLGELFNALKPKGVGVLDGFATTAEAYRTLLMQDNLKGSLVFRYC